MNEDNIVKSANLIKTLLQIASDEYGIIMYFFSRFGSTADAVLQLNSEDKNKHKFIMMQLPEVIDKSSEAYNAGYKNICKIGKERIRKAGDKILKETDNENRCWIQCIQIGFIQLRIMES